VIQHVGRLFVHSDIGLLAGGTHDLLGLLEDLLSDARRIVEQLDRV